MIGEPSCCSTRLLNPTEENDITGDGGKEKVEIETIVVVFLFLVEGERVM